MPEKEIRVAAVVVMVSDHVVGGDWGERRPSSAVLEPHSDSAGV